VYIRTLDFFSFLAKENFEFGVYKHVSGSDDRTQLNQIRVHITYIRVCYTRFRTAEREEKGVPGGCSSAGKRPTRRAPPPRRSHEDCERPESEGGDFVFFFFSTRGSRVNYPSAEGDLGLSEQRGLKAL
jgi:hypothetical protein